MTAHTTPVYRLLRVGTELLATDRYYFRGAWYLTMYDRIAGFNTSRYRRLCTPREVRLAKAWGII